MNRPLLVGQAPSSTSNPERAFSGRSGRKIADLMGIDAVDDWYEQLCQTFEPVNLITRYACRRADKGDSFSMAEARQAALGLKVAFPAGRFVLVGQQVRQAFGVRLAATCRWMVWGDRHVALLPHPSGINAWYNDAANRERASAFLREERRRVEWLNELEQRAR